MNDSKTEQSDTALRHHQLVQELIADASRDLERMRSAMAALEALDATSWRITRNAAQNLGARARALGLGILQHCASELEGFAEEVTRPDASDRSASLHCAMVAIEMLGIELDTLKQKSGSD